ncbi:separase isoform X1 [Tanacetum coccineum]
MEMMFSNIVSNVPLSQKSGCRLAQLYYDLAERMLLMGSMTKALEYARQGLKYRKSLLYECFILNECTGHMNPLVAARVWSIRFEDFILAPNYNFICFLSSIYQKATILELIGSGHEALQKLIWGKTFSLHRCLSIYVAHFQALIGRIYRKIQDFDQAKKGLVEAQEHYNHVSCEKCKLILEHDIRKECVKQTRTNGLPVAEAMEKFLSVGLMLKNHLDTKSHESSKSWERTCRICLLSILLEKGKEKVYANEKMEACEVFLENISMVISLSLFPERPPPPTTLVELLKLVQNKEIQVVHGTHIAELIYIICWVAYTEDKDKSAFDIPKEMLIATLKHALILSRETPELIKKVAQLLAIMYMLKYDEEETPKSENSLTHWQWACFFHQLTVGCGVNYLFSLRLSKVYGDSDADKILHRLTPKPGVDDLSDFVKEFYNELGPHTIVVVNVLGPKYKKFMPMFLPFLETSECVAILMISRFGSTCQPLYKLFTVNSSGPGFDHPTTWLLVRNKSDLEDEHNLADYV